MNAPDVSVLFEFIGKGATVVGAIAASWWAFEKWRKRDEHFPRMFFEVSIPSGRSHHAAKILKVPNLGEPNAEGRHG